LFKPRYALTLALGLMVFNASADVGATAQAPRISKPKPAPPIPPDVPPLPPAVIDNKLAVGGEDIKAREVSTRLSVEVRVNGRGPYRFIVDSGADTSAVGLRIAHDLQLPLGTPAILNGTTSRDLVDRVKVDQLTLGPSTIKNLELPALREVDLGGAGLIGIDALVQQRLMMDFEKHLIKVEDASKPPPFSPDEIVVTARRQRGQLILTQVRAGRIHLNAVIDTGSEISIGNLALRDQLLRRNRDRFWSVPATGVTGVTVNLQLAIVGELQLGPVTLRNVPMAFADVPPFKLFGLSKEPSLLLGTDVLETFRRVSLDFRARKVRFQLRRCGTEGIMIHTSPTDSFTRLSSSGDADVCGR
jgi:Aspartyl protease